MTELRVFGPYNGGAIHTNMNKIMREFSATSDGGGCSMPEMIYDMDVTVASEHVDAFKLACSGHRYHVVERGADFQTAIRIAVLLAEQAGKVH